MGAADDPVLEALDALADVIDENVARAKAIKERIAHVREARERGMSYAEMAPEHEVPIVRLVSQSATALDTFGVRLRRALAQQLYNEGLTMEQVAQVFGVTRQRVSALLKVGNQ
jgi:transcriptional regulator with XRE-family HTH domain